MQTFQPGVQNLILPPGQFVHALVGGDDYDDDALTLFAAMTSQPTATRKTLINHVITSLKAEGIWDDLDEIWFFAAHDSQAARLGWKRYKDITEVNSPTFTTDTGYTGNGTNSYLRTNYTPSTDAVQYTQNDGSFGVYSRTNAQGLNDMGARAGITTRQMLMNARNTSNVANVRVNTASGDLTYSATDSSGLILGRRTASNAQQSYRNGAEVAADTDASQGLPEYEVYICCFNNAGTAANFSTRQYAMAFIGASLTSTQQASLYTIVNDYLTWLQNPIQFDVTTSWKVPPNVSSITVEAWGGGGNGGAGPTDGPSLSQGGGGGGGGAYASSVITVTPLQTYTVTVGGVAGISQVVGDSQTVRALGGNNASADSIFGASGGSSASSIGTTKHAGGGGGNSQAAADTGGGGGGGAAGRTGAGGTGSNNSTTTGGTGGSAGSGGGGGAGGRGGNATSNSGINNGIAAPGGGGGGAGGSSNSAGAGQPGRVIITW